MANAARNVLVAAIVLLCIGCSVELQEPLADPADSKHDERLYGLWVNSEEPLGEIQYLHIGGASYDPLKPEAETPDSGWMHAIHVTHRQAWESVGQSKMVVEALTEFYFVPFMIDGQSFASLAVVFDELPANDSTARKNDNDNVEEEIEDFGPIFSFARYKVNGDELEVSFPDSKGVAWYVKKGRLQGEVSYAYGFLWRTVSQVVIENSTEEVLEFLASDDGEDIFPKDLTYRYKRIR